MMTRELSWTGCLGESMLRRALLLQRKVSAVKALALAPLCTAPQNVTSDKFAHNLMEYHQRVCGHRAGPCDWQLVHAP